METVRKTMASSVADFIRVMNTTKTALEIDVLRKIIDTIQSSSRGHASEIIDLAFSVTGYGKAEVPGGESLAAGNCITMLVKYLTLRAKEPTPTNESLDEHVLALINEAVKLYSEVQTNRGVKIVTQEKRS